MNKETTMGTKQQYWDLINKDLQELKGKTLYKTEFKKIEDEIILTFKSIEDGKLSAIKLTNCYAFKDLGVFNYPIEEVLVKEVGHFFREYCIAKGIDYQECCQFEIYPIDYKEKLKDGLQYKTFFAICDKVEYLSNLREEIDFW